MFICSDWYLRFLSLSCTFLNRKWWVWWQLSRSYWHLRCPGWDLELEKNQQTTLQWRWEESVVVPSEKVSQQTSPHTSESLFSWYKDQHLHWSNSQQFLDFLPMISWSEHHSFCHPSLVQLSGTYQSIRGIYKLLGQCTPRDKKTQAPSMGWGGNCEALTCPLPRTEVVAPAYPFLSPTSACCVEARPISWILASKENKAPTSMYVNSFRVHMYFVIGSKY